MAKVNKLLVNKDATIKEAIKIIDRGKLRTAIVVDDNNKLCGMITDGDIRRGILKGENIANKVENIMNKNPIYASKRKLKGEILSILKDKKLLGLPIIDNNKKIKDYCFLSSGGSEILSFNESLKIENNNINRILVIGGAGYIGSVLVRKLLNKNYKVTVLDNFIYNQNSLFDISNTPNLKIIEGDTRHIEKVTEAIVDVDAVVHLAELVGDPACALEPKKTQEINNLATKNIASVCKYFQINRLVYASSCSVYGASKGEELLNENSEINPVSLYAKMKLESENALKEAQDDTFLPTILRFATVFGFSYRPRFDLVVNLLTAKALREKEIVIFGGDQWRPNVHVSDIAKTIISILEAPLEKVGGEVFNVGSEKNNHTINEIGEIIKNEIPSTNILVEDKKVDKRNYKVNFSKLRKVVGVDINKSISDGVRELKHSLNKNPELNYQAKEYSNIKFLKDKQIRDKLNQEEL